ncbi:uncharacterized protein C2orf72 homolog [Suricata suricatta]|uniref:uncharacterized protein C2orf72 homolog n=1 Tax=Suricata suricatta TaxID=37032 RepID=UPI0011559EBE|nr:uncharacterized protein C2orf72 homolog [Suricata suricatta]
MCPRPRPAAGGGTGIPARGPGVARGPAPGGVSHRAPAPREAGGPVQAAAYCPGHPASSLAVQAAACRALQAAGSSRPGAWERPGLPALLACFSWGPWSRGKDPDAASPSDPAQGHLRDPEEELALTAAFPNGDCEDPEKGLRACDGFVHAPAEPAGGSR